MIIDETHFASLAGKVSMVAGGFDPLHSGHIAYFRCAAELDAPVLCCVSSDDWVRRKHRPLLTQEERAAVIDAIRFIDYTYLERTSTLETLKALRPRSYVKGLDWSGRLPQEEVEVCEVLGIEVVYLDTVLSSSTEILRRFEGS